MSLLSAAELASIQAEANKLLDTTAAIMRRTPSNDGLGSQSESWPTIATVPAMMTTPNGSFIQKQAEALGELASWLVFVPVGTDIQRYDRITINSQTLEVQAVYSPLSYAGLIRMLASEIR